MMMKAIAARQLAGALLGGALLLISGCTKKAAEAPEVSVTVQTAHPAVADISEEIGADAVFAPLAQAAISSRISSAIRAEYVQRGAHVRKGQLLVTLEDRDLRGSALDSRGAVTAAEANLRATTDATVPEDLKKAEDEVANSKAARDVTQRASDERKKLFQQGALSGRDADTAYAAAVQAQSAYEQATRHLEAVRRTTSLTAKETAQGQLVSARGRLENAQALAEYASLRSPIEGVVTDRPLFPGETAAAGATVITVMDTSSLLAKLHLAQASAQKLRPGSKAEISVPGVEGPVQAIVSLISPALDPGSTTVEVWLKLPNADGRLKVGTPVHVVMAGATTANALQIPAVAILPATDGGSSVMVVGPDGIAHRRAVKVGVRTPKTVQIISGLAATDTVITEGGYGLDDGTKVTVASAGLSGEED